MKKQHKKWCSEEIEKRQETETSRRLKGQTMKTTRDTENHNNKKRQQIKQNEGKKTES